MPLKLTSFEQIQHPLANKIPFKLWFKYFQDKSIFPQSTEEEMAEENTVRERTGTLDDDELKVLKLASRQTFFDIRNKTNHGMQRTSPLLQRRLWIVWFSSHSDTDVADWLRTGPKECPFEILSLYDRLQIAEFQNRHDVQLALIAHASSVLRINLKEYDQLNAMLFARVIPHQTGLSNPMSPNDLQRVQEDLENIPFCHALRQFLSTALNVELDKQEILSTISHGSNDHSSLYFLLCHLSQKILITEICTQNLVERDKHRLQGKPEYFAHDAVIAQWQDLIHFVGKLMVTVVEAQRIDLLLFFRKWKEFFKPIAKEVLLAAIGTGNADYAEKMLTFLESDYRLCNTLHEQLINVPAELRACLIQLRENNNPFYQTLVTKYPLQTSTALPRTRPSEDDDNDTQSPTTSTRNNKRGFFQSVDETPNDLQKMQEAQLELFFRKRAKK